MFIFLKILIIDVHAQTTVSGSLNGTWTKTGNPYYVTGHCTVDISNTLTIEPGVEIYFQGDYSFNVYGTFDVFGAIGDTVVFTIDPDSTSEFAGIRFLDNIGNGTISYAKIEYSQANGALPNDRGGAIFHDGSSITISHCDISNCSATGLGGAIAIESSAIIKYCNIHHDSSRYGGGIYTKFFDTIIKNNYIYSNMASLAGGGFHATGLDNQPRLENNIFFNNSAREGGGVGFNAGNKALLINNILYNNSASLYGGAAQVKFHFNGSSPVFYNNIIWNNTAASEGSQIYIETNATLDIDFCDIDGGEAGIANYGALNYGSNNINLNPIFNDPINADFTFEANSPLVDSGTNTGAPADDFDGNSRPFDGDRDGTATVDIGAYEYINTVPQIISTANENATEDSEYIYQVSVDDPDVGESIIYSLTQSPDFLSISQTGLIIGTPGNDDVGPHDVTVRVEDRNGASATQPYTLTVANVNDPPVVDDIPGEIINEGEIFAPILLDNFVEDVDNPDEEISWDYSGNVDLMVDINPLTRVAIVSIPNSEWHGSETITFSATDPGLLTDSDDAVFTVNSVNDPPVAVDDAVSTNEDAAVVIDVLSNDSDSDGVLVPSSVIVTGGPSNGGTSVNTTTGAVTYTPDADWFGEDTFTYTVEDDSGAVSNEATVTVIVNSINDAPVAVDDATGTNEDAAVVINVLSNDSDSDGVLVPSSVTVTGVPTNGGTSVNTTTGAVTYTPAADWFGEDTFTYTVEDDGGAVSNEATVTVTVSSVNDSPVAGDDIANTDEDTAVIIDVLANDSDSDGSLVPSSVLVTGGPTNGGTSVNTSTGEVTYTPTTGWNGVDTFTYTVEDDSGAVSNEATVSIAVGSVNDFPIAVDDAANTNEDAAVVINVLSNDSDIDGVLIPSSVVVTGGPSNGGTSVNTTTGEVTYTPTTGWNGVDTFTYTVEDDSSAVSNTATVTVTVGSVNDPPVAVDDAAGTNEEVAVIIDVLANDTDSDGVLVPSSVTVTNDPTNGGTSVNTTTGEITYTPAADWFGEDTFTYTVEDDSSAVSNEATVTVTVGSVNDAPVILPLPELTFNEDDSLVYAISNLYDYVTDPDNPDSVLIYTLNIGNHVTVIPDSPNVILRAPANWFGPDTLELIISDGELSDTAQVFVTVNPINDAPEFVNWPDTVQFTDLSDTVLTMLDYVNDIDSPDTSLIWQFAVSNDSVNWQFDSLTTELTLTAPGFMGTVTMFCTVIDDSLAFVQDSFAVKVLADPTGIEDFVTQIPEKYFLNQNYPNPFNPVTKIKYGLLKSGKVEIDVYNIIGQKVVKLLNEFKPAGYHEINFDGGNLPSGVYFYRIQTKGFNSVKKMILIK